MAELPPLPKGFTLDRVPPPPEGFTVDKPKRKRQIANPVTEFAYGSMLGMGQARSGAEQLLDTVSSTARRPFVGEEEPMFPEADAEIAARDARIQELGLPGKGGAMVGEALPSMALPGGPQGKLATKIVGGVAADVAASVADPVREDETRLGNLQRAATFSGAFRGVGGGLSAGYRRLSNARAGNLADADAKALIDAADAENIRVFYQDISDGSLAVKADIAARSIFGRGSRRAQNQEAYDAASRWLSKVGGSNDDFAELVQTGIQRKLDIFKKKASQLYSKAGNKIGGGDVPLPTFHKAADDAIAAELAKGTRADPRVIDLLERYRQAPAENFDGMIELRSEMLRDLRKLDGSMTSERALSHSARVQIGNVIDSINDDMGDFADQFGAKQEWLAANKFYYDNVVEFQIGKLKNYLNEDSAANFDMQAAWRYLSQPSTNPSRAKRMWDALDSRGRAAVRTGLLMEAAEVATPTSGPFSPAKYASYLEKRMPVINQFFPGQRGDEIRGLVKVMRATQQSADILAQPTGVQTIPFLLGFGTAIEPVAGATAVTGLGGTKLLFETRMGRNLLLAADKATPGSQEFDRVLERMVTFLSRGSN